METWELTEYEQVREPQEITMDADIASSLRPLYREIICPLCLDILDKTVTTRECLHRFCFSCITKALKNGSKECPTCRRKLTSRPCFKEDPNFDQLIAKIYQGENDKPQEPTKVNLIAPDCEIILRPLNDQRTRYIKCPPSTTIDHLSKYLSMRPEGSRMPDLNRDEEYKLCIVANRSKGHYEMLPGKLKLEEIKDTYNRELDTPLELYFYEPNKD